MNTEVNDIDVFFKFSNNELNILLSNKLSSKIGVIKISNTIKNEIDNANL